MELIIALVLLSLTSTTTIWLVDTVLHSDKPAGDVQARYSAIACIETTLQKPESNTSCDQDVFVIYP
ncbi:hypothetical protein [Ectothiorhodospira haloalkaliphila]|uniref:hypothetical protein n=1 Tax=Ectothiorhodospira haloalkaliphila TaxID=421628 RepID=UPI003B75BBB1